MNRTLLILALFGSVACHRNKPPPQAAAAADHGAQLYAKYCALCHGEHEEGYAADNAPSLVSSTFRQTATEAFLRTAIERGRPGTAMAGYARAFGGPLSNGDVGELIAFLRKDAPPFSLPVPPGPGDAQKGKVTYDANCMACHGTPNQRGNAVHLANPAFLASVSDAYLRVAIEQGRPGTRMQAWAGKLSQGEIADVIAYLNSLAHPVPPPVVSPTPEKTLPITGPVVLNPHGKAPDFALKEDLYVPVEQLGKAFDEKRRVVVIDARAPSDYLRLHIQGAISVPYYDMKALDQVPNDGTWVVAYCACPHHVSGVVVQELRKRGYKHTAVLDEGVFFWQQHGHPVVAAPDQLPVAAPPPVPVSAPKAFPGTTAK